MRAFRFVAAIAAVPLFLASAETAEQTAALDEVVCRAQGRAASRLQSRARVCKTRREWRIIDDETLAATTRVQNGGRYNPPSEAVRPQ